MSPGAPSRKWGARRVLPAAVVVAALAGIGAAALIKPAPAPASAGRSAATTLIRQVAITSAIRACPPGANSGQNRVALFAASPAASASAASGVAASPGTAAEGTAGLTALSQSGAKVTPGQAKGSTGASPASQTAPGSLSLLQVPTAATTSKQQAWSMTASGAMAQGVEAEVGDGSGLTDVRCGEPGSSIWFAGPGQSDGAGQIQLDLMNVDSLAATVNLTVITDAGTAQSGGNTGITVPPDSLVTQSLSAEANGASVTAINVRTSVGRVAAVVSESTSHGVSSWVPSTAAPATSLVIPGVPQSSSAASLFLVVPGSANAKVNVVAIGSQGRYQPFGSQSINMPGQSASDVQLTPVGGSAAALQITSNVPVAAEVQVPGASNSLGTFTAAATPVTEQAVIAGNSDSGGNAAEVALSAPGTAVRVRISEVAQNTQSAQTDGAAQQVTVPAGHTVVFQAKEPQGARHGTPFTIVISPQPGSGPLYAARIETQGQNAVSIITAVSALTTIGLPPARQSYTAIWP